MGTDPTVITPQIRPHHSLDGVQVVDPIEDAQFALLTPEAVAPQNCDTDRFYFPIDAAATVETDRVETPYLVNVWIRTDEGDLVADGVDGETTVPEGRYNVELSTNRMKLYLAIEGGIEVTTTATERVRFAVTETDRVHVGARSFHEQPAATVTTTDAPRDVMAAVSTLGSALKTTSPERSFPTLRGHPPLIDRGTALEIPEGIDPPETDVRIELPPRLEYVYPVASLAYYLGATVEPGPEPRLVAGDCERSLEGPDGFEATVARVLKHLFLLDCVTRTEGYYQVDLHERTLVEDAVDLDFAALYDRSLADQVAAYLDVPFDRVSDAVPTWKLTADVVPEAAHVSTFPFLADELAVVRCPDAASIGRRSVEDLGEQVEAFFRNRPGALTRGDAGGGVRAETAASTVDGEVFQPVDADSIEQVYVGDGIPFGASKMTVDAYYRRLDHEPAAQPRIRVAVVCNDPEMAAENVVSELYGAREWLDFDISLHSSLTKSEMRDLLGRDVDFLHYVGHVDDEGIRCADGVLDAATLDDVGVDAFLLNACNSYEQGRALVDGGALAGIATVTDVLDERASQVGRTVARLLNQGFSLSATLPIIKKHERSGQHYVVIGDGSVSVVTNESGTPNCASLRRLDQDTYEVSLIGYPNLRKSLGAMFKPLIKENGTRYLNAGSMGSFNVSTAELRQFLLQQNIPIKYDSNLYWSDTLDL
jgi:hypothetical protein